MNQAEYSRELFIGAVGRWNEIAAEKNREEILAFVNLLFGGLSEVAGRSTKEFLMEVLSGRVQILDINRIKIRD